MQTYLHVPMGYAKKLKRRIPVVGRKRTSLQVRGRVPRHNRYLDSHSMGMCNIQGETGCVRGGDEEV